MNLLNAQLPGQMLQKGRFTVTGIAKQDRQIDLSGDNFRQQRRIQPGFHISFDRER